ncbi:MAG: 4-hydroxybenzoate octaprenyltransferase [Nitrospirales bacterium]|nr:4-hydroxybenzoate octaprenyltransferase [Nitrospirales bacterium]
MLFPSPQPSPKKGKGVKPLLPPHPSPGNSFAHLIRLSNQTGTLLLLFPSLWALVLASNGTPEWSLIVVFTLGAFCMRSAGVVMNDLADRSIDSEVQRTQHRPLASGALSRIQGLLVALLFLSLSLGLLTFLNPLVIALSPIAFLLAAIYPFSKRVIHIPQLVLGIAFGWGAVMAWAAVRHQLESATWLVFAATVCWAIAYDTIYALQDRDDDIRVGVKSSAILFGSYTWLGVATAFALMLGCLGVAGWILKLAPIFYVILIVTCGFFIHQIVRLRKYVNPTESFSMFKQHVWVGLVVLGGMWLGCVI